MKRVTPGSQANAMTSFRQQQQQQKIKGSHFKQSLVDRSIQGSEWGQDSNLNQS